MGLTVCSLPFRLLRPRLDRLGGFPDGRMGIWLAMRKGKMTA